MLELGKFYIEKIRQKMSQVYFFTKKSKYGKSYEGFQITLYKSGFWTISRMRGPWSYFASTMHKRLKSHQVKPYGGIIQKRIKYELVKKTFRMKV